MSLRAAHNRRVPIGRATLRAEIRARELFAERHYANEYRQHITGGIAK